MSVILFNHMKFRAQLPGPQNSEFVIAKSECQKEIKNKHLTIYMSNNFQNIQFYFHFNSIKIGKSVLLIVLW